MRSNFKEKPGNLREIFVFLIATALGAGLAPVAPGTFGTLAAVPLVYFLCEESLLFRLLFWMALTAVGIWAAAEFDLKMKSNDDSRIVVDEVIGFGLAAWTVGQDWRTWILAFFLFRFFDVLKPPPIRQLDRWSKKQTAPLRRGFGVIVDDIVAGLMSLSLILLLQWLSIVR